MTVKVEISILNFQMGKIFEQNYLENCNSFHLKLRGLFLPQIFWRLDHVPDTVLEPE